MDVEGTREIDLKFTSLAAAKQVFVIIDLALVDFSPRSASGLSFAAPGRRCPARKGRSLFSAAARREGLGDDTSRSIRSRR